MYAFLTKIEETPVHVIYKFETHISNKSYTKPDGHTHDDSKTIFGSGIFDKQANILKLQNGTDPYFIGFNEEIPAIEKKLKEINSTSKQFPATLTIR